MSLDQLFIINYVTMHYVVGGQGYNYMQWYIYIKNGIYIELFPYK